MTPINDYSLQLARKRVDAFDALMEQHRQAMRCRDCEELLQSGIGAYEWLARADEIIRQAAVEGFDVPEDIVTTISALYQAWLRPCPYVEERINEQQKRGFAVANLDEFKRAYEAVRAKVSLLEMEDHLESAFQGRVFDIPFWNEAHKLRST